MSTRVTIFENVKATLDSWLMSTGDGWINWSTMYWLEFLNLRRMVAKSRSGRTCWRTALYYVWTSCFPAPRCFFRCPSLIQQLILKAKYSRNIVFFFLEQIRCWSMPPEVYLILHLLSRTSFICSYVIEVCSRRQVHFL